MSTAPELIVIVPSRGRPAAAAELVSAFRDTCTASTRLVLAIDEDDQSGPDYIQVVADAHKQAVPPALAVVSVASAPSTMVKALNVVAVAEAGAVDAIAFMGDDHRPRTSGWDRAYLSALRQMGTGIVYGDDLLQHERIPTQVAMTSGIVQALGHMAPPTLTHLFVDNYWRDLGEGAGCLHYLPDVVVEHVHPFAGKAPMDGGYARVNAHAMYRADSVAYAAYVVDHLADDIAKVKALR